MSKYPPSERVTAGKLFTGDVLLVRERQSDTLWSNHEPIPAGLYKVTAIDVSWDRRGRKAVRYYGLNLTASDDQALYTTSVSSVTRLNRVTP